MRNNAQHVVADIASDGSPNSSRTYFLERNDFKPLKLGEWQNSSSPVFSLLILVPLFRANFQSIVGIPEPSSR